LLRTRGPDKCNAYCPFMPEVVRHLRREDEHIVRELAALFGAGEDAFAVAGWAEALLKGRAEEAPILDRFIGC
jgi:hypothetical protein